MTILRFSACLLCCAFILVSCQSTPDKPVPRTHVVEIKEMKFQPAELVLNQGDSVVWINRDFVAHDVTEEPSRVWTSSVIPAGASWRMVVTKSADYFCSLHVVMKGKLVVK